MKQIDIIAPGRMRGSRFEGAFEEYRRQLSWPLKLYEIESKHKQSEKIIKDEHTQIEAALDSSAVIFALDERGKSLKSLEFAGLFKNFQLEGRNHAQFVIGGADGLSDTIRGRAQFLLSFGRQTWPHLLARLMLLEQIYRAQQILAGHPYHRE